MQAQEQREEVFQNAREGKKAASYANLAEYFEQHTDELMVSLSTEVHVLRDTVLLIEAFLSSGTPLELMPFFKTILERGGHCSVGD